MVDKHNEKGYAMTQTVNQIGQVFKFHYNTKPRVGVFVENKGNGLYLFYDFISEGYRTFKNHKIVNCLDVTNQCVKTTDLDRKFKSNIRTFVNGQFLYAVNIQ